MIIPEPSSHEAFSLDSRRLHEILRHAKPLGHHEDASTLNLGFGFLYYGLVRMLRPRHVVVIGSGYGFSVVCLALGLKDNAHGQLTFVDPSYSVLRDGLLHTVGGTAQWDEPEKVRAHFRRFGVEDLVTHYRLTSGAFFDGWNERDLPPIDIAFIDGNHSYEDVRADFLNASARMKRNGYLLLHDTNIYVREFLRHAGVKRWLKVLEREPSRFQLVDFPFASGVALVRLLDDSPWLPAE
ncbi:MAG TPA: class I SAM-dependent methyltransferase [Usitatibacter sp.]|jgi:predicted O-methyltransferase YrrM|nr:class I SAM-dependent methyltransferase [Usitatibacter sp.]